MKKLTNAEIRRTNRSNLYRLICERGPLSRQEMVRELRLCLPTVTQNLEELLAAGLVEESGLVGNTGGRRAQTYSMVPGLRCAVGLDVTRHHITAVAVDLAGEIVGKRRVRRDFARTAEYFGQAGALVRGLLEEQGVPAGRVLGAGVGLPALTTADNRAIFYGKILGVSVLTAEEFAEYLPFPVKLFNDANAAGFSEVWSGALYRNAFYLMLSNNVGGSVLIDGEVYAGDGLKSGEIGHLTLFPGGRPCYCGQRGCVDAYCAASVLAEHTGGDLGRFFQLLREGEREARRIWEEYTDRLALVINNLRLLFDCTVILGGYVGGYAADYLGEIREKARRVSSFDYPPESVAACRYRTESIAAGAALDYIAAFRAEI